MKLFNPHNNLNFPTNNQNKKKEDRLIVLEMKLN